MSHSPLRYPGGKGKLAPSIAQIIVANRLCGGHYAEPYAGGSGVGLYLLFNEYVDVFHLNDIDPSIYAFWHTVLNNTAWLCDRISEVTVSPEEWKFQREIHANPTAASRQDLGFAAFFLNRTNRSGIIKSGGMIGGTKQEGKWKLDVRFNKKTLIERIQAISELRSRISLTNLDAERFIVKRVPALPQKSLVYFDPPYFVKGSGLYENHYVSDDHQRLSQIILSDVPRKWLVSYDAHPKIVNMYEKKRSYIYGLQYQAAEKYKGQEIMVFSDDLKLPLTPDRLFPKLIME